MQFLYPGFLWALGVLAIPIIIHLFHFRRFKTIYFSNVSLLREVKEESATRSKIRHWLVLLARLLALTFLVLAFAQPIIPQEQEAIDQGQKTVSIFLDNSFSMDALGEDVSLLDNARSVARKIAMGYSPQDRFQLLTHDFEGQHQRLVDREQLTEMIEEVAVTPASRSLEAIESRMEEATAAAAHPDFYYISDFQTHMVNLEPDTTHQNYFVPLEVAARQNIAIDSVWLDAPVQVLNTPSTVMVQLTNYGREAATNVSLTLKVNGERKAIGDADVAPGATIVDTLRFTVTQEGWNAAEVEITDYPITFDDSYYFTFYTPSAIQVMVINEDAFSPYFAALSGQSFLAIENVSSTQLNYGSFDNYRLIVLNQVRDVSTGLQEALSRFVQQGGNLLVFPPANADLSAYNRWLAGLAEAQYEPWVEGQRTIRGLNTDQGLFKGVFDQLPDNLMLPGVFQFYPITRPTRSSMVPILRLDNGEIFLSVTTKGEGRVYLMGSPLQLAATDLPKHSLFAVMVVQVALSGTTDYPLAFTLGEDETLRVPVITEGDQQLRLRSNTAENKIDIIPPQQPLGEQTVLRFTAGGEVLHQKMDAGIYSLYLADAPDTPIQLLAFNYNRQESAMRYTSAEQLAERYDNAAVTMLNSNVEGLSDRIQGLSRGIALWKVCLILALLFLGAEIILLRLFPGN